MKALKALLVLAVLVTASVSRAQFMMGGGGALPYESMMLMGFGPSGPNIRSDIAKELALTSDQEKKLRDLQAEQMEKMMSMRGQGGGQADEAEREKMRKTMTEMMTTADKNALAVLDEKQRKRLHELWIQQQGNRAITHEPIQKELGLSDTQKAKIKSLVDKSNQANQALFQKMRNQEIDFQEVRETSEKNGKVLNEELGKLLTTDQAKKLKEMGGAEFKFENQGGIG